MAHSSIGLGIAGVSLAGVAIACYPIALKFASDIFRISKFAVRQVYISVRAKQTKKPRDGQDPTYVALGSSFAAGPMVGSSIPDAIGFMQGSKAYPEILADKAGLAGTDKFVNATSSGLRLADVVEAQLPHLGPHTQLVTLTAGGNDLHLSRDAVLLGILNTLRSPAWLQRWIRWAAMAIYDPLAPASSRPFETLRKEFDRVFAEIRRRSPEAMVVVITYTTFLPPKSALPPLNSAETEVLREVAGWLRRVTKISARRNRAIVVDMATASIDHHADSEVPWSTGFTGSAPFHPNEQGHIIAAESIQEKIIEPYFLAAGAHST